MHSWENQRQRGKFREWSIFGGSELTIHFNLKKLSLGDTGAERVEIKKSIFQESGLRTQRLQGSNYLMLMYSIYMNIYCWNGSDQDSVKAFCWLIAFPLHNLWSQPTTVTLYIFPPIFFSSIMHQTLLRYLVRKGNIAYQLSFNS